MKALLAGLLLVTAVLATASDPPLPKGILALPAYPAPELRLADMDGNTFELLDAEGRWVFVHFWASWCGPCRREMPAIQRLTERLPEGLGIVLINTAEDEDTVFSFLAETAPELSSLLDRDGLATKAWQPRGLPATYLVGPAGQVRYQALGGRDWDTAPYLEFLERIAAEAGDTGH